MTMLHRSVPARAGAVALLTIGGLAVTGAPAQAAPAPDLAVIPISTGLARGVDAAKAKPFKFTVTNSGDATAEDVVYRINTVGLNSRRVGFVLPAGCTERGAHLYECSLGDLPAGTSADIGIPLFSTGGKGDGGVLTVGVLTPLPDEDAIVDVPVEVTKRGYDLTSWAQDVQANVVVDGAVTNEPDLRPVRRGETVPLDWAVYNDGSRRATGVFYGLTLPAGVTFAELPDTCVQQEILGRAQAFCEDAGAVLRPGQYYTDDVTVTVGADVTEPVLREGDLFAYGLDAAQGAPEEEARSAGPAQRRSFEEVDPADNHTVFEAFVDLSAQPTPTPTPSGEPTATPTVAPTGTPTAGPTTTPGAGGGGGGDDDPSLPVTGVQAGLIGGIGAAVLLAGGGLLLLSRRRRVVLVNPGDETSND
ncbi:LPXTG cell wall anchor domain-containing protein [Micromonospora endolithica]|uniref:LPXTG cell wall anchor domain-containing protein n=1 Tax=Micromonospora endolithica TaxID=230091 RepID=A0A3A9ZKJ8_9ACTN|nr:LPXTG cell wall anchor domain-containing protein [Micromonospora endolithica]RKN48374.1 LPXTG cell wall anchor domain-containing protein [Micromonospora endolithica]TWJ24556.1 LPXTG-motif cell wall-anchored protein [Micromonospora endolithica]